VIFRQPDKDAEPEASAGPPPPPRVEREPSPPTAETGAIADRIQSVIDAAERAAADIVADAENRARQQLEESKTKAEQLAMTRIRSIYELTDGLIEQARSVRERSDALLSALDDAVHELGSDAEAPAPVETFDRSRETEREARKEDAIERLRTDLDELRREQASPPEPTEPPELRREPEAALAEKPEAPVDSIEEPQRPRLPRRRSNGSASDGARLLAAQMVISGSSREDVERRLREEFDVADTAAVLDEVLGPAGQAPR
jgi:hypothetical protein